MPIPWNDSQSSYDEWRQEIAELIGVHATELLVVGSAQLGYSISPKQIFKPFTQNNSPDSSDIDLAVVNHQLFEKAWQELRTLFHEDRLTDDTRGYTRKLLMEECIPLDHILEFFSFGPKWSKAADAGIEKLKTDFWDATINYRLYRNMEALHRYQEKAVQVVFNQYVAKYSMPKS